jgi:hypothetical protein
VPTLCVENVIEAGLTVTGATPAPFSDEVSVLEGAGAFSFTVKVADSAASTLGVNVTPTRHEVFGGKLLLQLLVSLKSGLLSVIREILTAPDWLFVRVKFTGLPVVWMATLPKLYEAGASVAAGTPVPLSDALSVLYGVAAFSFTVKIPDSAPSTLGVNVTLMAHDFPAARLLPQVVVRLKSARLRVRLEIVSATD